MQVQIQAELISWLTSAQLFDWLAAQTIPWWATGLLYAFLGLTGALIIVFGFVGGAVPGIAGQAQIDEDTARLRQLDKRIDQLANQPNIEANQVQALEGTVNNLRRSLQAERWKQFAIAGFLYVFLGAIIASALAGNYFEAIAIGAGWTSVLGNLGLKTDYQERKSQKDSELANLLNRTEYVENKLEVHGEAVDQPNFRNLGELRMDINVVKAL